MTLVLLVLLLLLVHLGLAVALGIIEGACGTSGSCMEVALCVARGCAYVPETF